MVPRPLYGAHMTNLISGSKIAISPLPGALGAVVEGLEVAKLSDDALAEIAVDLKAAWAEHLVLFFPGANLAPIDQMRMARLFGNHIAATTEAGGDYRNAPSLRDEGFPEILVLDTELKLDPRQTAVWHTDVTFTDNPPIGSLFVMEIAAKSGGDTMWSNQIKAYKSLSAPIQEFISGLSANHGRPPQTGTSVHPMVREHHVTGEKALFVNRGWTNSIVGLKPLESMYLLETINQTAERPELQIRWKWTSGDAALWDNRYTMHYAVNDYHGQRRRARRATIYNV